MLILNCGGTFNKVYNPINGSLDVAYDNLAIETILESMNVGVNLAGVLYKDSLEMDSNDRKVIANIIMESKDDIFVIVHGTDTMHETAEFLAEIFQDRKIVLTGAMKPFEIENVEASLNLGLSIGYINGINESGIYICMSGIFSKWDEIVKNRKIGKFEIVG